MEHKQKGLEKIGSYSRVQSFHLTEYQVHALHDNVIC